MIGAIAGDIIGSIYEWNPIKTKEFSLFNSECHFTDDSVLTVAIASSILTGESYEYSIREIGRRYPNAGYGGSFIQWLLSDNPKPYDSWGNGSAMRVSPVGYAFDTEDRVLEEAENSAAITHSHPKGIMGAQATALAVFMARTGHSKDQIRERISEQFKYDLDRTVDEIRPGYSFDVSCQGTVPEAIISFLESDSYEDAVRNAISLGGDADTLACIAGSIAEAFYKGVPAGVRVKVKELLAPDLLEITERFVRKYL